MTIKEFKIQLALGMISNDEKLNIANTVTTSKRILTILSRDEDVWIRGYVALNKNTPKEILVKLSKDKNSYVRKGVYNNNKTHIQSQRKHDY